MATGPFRDVWPFACCHFSETMPAPALSEWPQKLYVYRLCRFSNTRRSVATVINQAQVEWNAVKTKWPAQNTNRIHNYFNRHLSIILRCPLFRITVHCSTSLSTVPHHCAQFCFSRLGMCITAVSGHKKFKSFQRQKGETRPWLVRQVTSTIGHSASAP